MNYTYQMFPRHYIITSARQTLLLEKHCSWVESYFNSRVILINKVVLDQLNCERTLAHTTSTNHHQFVLRHRRNVHNTI